MGWRCTPSWLTLKCFRWLNFTVSFYVGQFCLCVCICATCLLPIEGRRRCWILTQMPKIDLDLLCVSGRPWTWLQSPCLSLLSSWDYSYQACHTRSWYRWALFHYMEILQFVCLPIRSIWTVSKFWLYEVLPLWTQVNAVMAVRHQIFLWA